MKSIENEMIRIATISAETFFYNNIKINPNPGNFYVGENEIGGQCSDYALDFVTRWNKEYHENEAEIVVVNQDCGIQSGSYKIVREVSNFFKELPAFIRSKHSKESGWLFNLPKENGGYIDLVLYHPNLWLYEVKQTSTYEVEAHFGEKKNGYERSSCMGKDSGYRY